MSAVREKLWSYQDLLTLRAVYWLRQRKDAGDVDSAKIPATPMNQVRGVLEQTVKQGLDPWNDPSVEIRIDLDGRIFVVQGNGDRRDVFGQTALDHAQSVDLLDAFFKSPGLARPTEHVRIAPARLAGEPHLLQTRIGTQSLLSLAEDGYASSSIARLYELPEEQVEEALEYEWGLAA
ncbi:MAG: DUF433 domain-containing protein [Propionibacteriaceae bacterium]|nr:DUF433 domain-containing protein [Propionibacteriaceae bacterium]